MAKPVKHVTPPDRMDRWKKMWATPRLLDAEATDLAFEEFQEQFVPGHMHKLFLRSFGTPGAKFNNRFFSDHASFQNWDLKIGELVGAEGGHIEAIVIYGSPDRLEAHFLRGERRRRLRDIFIDDWHPACAIVRGGRVTLYVFIDNKMRGCIVNTVVTEGEPEESEAPVWVDQD
jgi:hypothetical protein